MPNGTFCRSHTAPEHRAARVDYPSPLETRIKQFVDAGGRYLITLKRRTRMHVQQRIGLESGVTFRAASRAQLDRDLVKSMVPLIAPFAISAHILRLPQQSRMRRDDAA